MGRVEAGRTKQPGPPAFRVCKATFVRVGSYPPARLLLTYIQSGIVALPTTSGNGPFHFCWSCFHCISLGDSLWRQRFSAIVVGAFSVAALAIAVLGVFGMTSYIVACRTFEIGVRIATGATPSDVLRMILGQSVSMALLGVALGLLGSLAVTRVLSTFLFGIEPTDPLTFGGVALLLLAAAAAASYIPSRRAATVDPIVALRME
jgi:ABC-type antimicrobial peptide transport system permease subunit